MKESIRWAVALALVGTVGACGSDEPAAPPATPDASVPDVGDAATPEIVDAADVAPEIEQPPAVEWVAPGDEDLAALVDPMIGTDGPGNTIPGAVLPHGMIRVSPDTDEGQGGIDAYDWSDPRIEGFTHTHLEGPGGSFNGYSQVLLMPTTDPEAIAIDDWAAAYGHDDEEAEPGYYAVTLATGVRVELTAAAHAGVHRYTFPAGEPRQVVLDLGHSNGQSKGGRIVVVDDHTLEGHGEWNVHPVLELTLGPERPTGFVSVWFRIVFDQPFGAPAFFRAGKAIEADGGEASDSKLGCTVAFPGAGPLEARVSISFVDPAQAEANFEAEVLDRSFDNVRQAARQAWNDRLRRIEVEGSDDLRRRFYTALYHTMLQPADHTEVGGRFASAADGEHAVFEAGERRFYTDDWCMWDTFRTSHPLATLVEPETRQDVIWSMLHLHDQGGWLPKCTWTASGYSRVMIGNHAVPIIADAWVKGLGGDLDPERVWQAVAKAGLEDTTIDGDFGLCGYLNLGTHATYLDLGYVPSECDGTQSVSMTLEYAYDDWTTARLAEALGREADRVIFDERAGGWKAHWNPDTGFMQPRLMDGSWKEPFDPGDTSDNNDFTEASSWIYSWFVPHDIPGLIEAMGGAESVEARLDAFFADGHFDPSNQPSFHVPWLYTHVGRPDRTQTLVADILETEFPSGPEGLPGNDDAGSMSAWFVLGALGLYPMAPGAPRWELGAPLVDRAVLHLHPTHFEGGTFVIEVERTAPSDGIVQSAALNGAPLERAWLTHDELTAGGTLHLLLGPAPSGWGAAP